ncbi:ROK family protein [Robertmurraya sp. Marseille-Q9965]
MKNYLVFDVGGSAVKHAVMNENGEILTKGSSPSITNDFHAFRDELLKIVDVKKDIFQIEGIAFSCPGGVDSESGVIGGASALPCIHGPNFKEIFGEETGLPVEIENDANCAALGEVWIGAAKDNQDVLFIVIGTGIGGAVVKERTIHKGKNLHGGEFGYMVFNVGDQKLQTWSHLASTRALVENAVRLSGVNDMDGKKVFELAEEGDEACIEALEQFYSFLAQGIYNLQYVYDPEKIVIGGAVSSRSDLIERIYEKMDGIFETVQIAKVRPVMETCHFQNDANLIGALYHFLQQQK